MVSERLRTLEAAAETGMEASHVREKGVMNQRREKTCNPTCSMYSYFRETAWIRMLIQDIEFSGRTHIFSSLLVRMNWRIMACTLRCSFRVTVVRVR